MNWKPLDTTETNLYKGIAILLIVTHNFMHLFPVPQQNEFTFFPERFIALLDLLWNEPENSVRALLSFYGHFGVQVFIFLSAYGLTKKLSHNIPGYIPFVLGRIKKIYPSFILAILLWATITGWINPEFLIPSAIDSWTNFGVLAPLKILYWNFEDLFYRIVLVSNFIPGQELNIVGPWWFVSFIFQFYLGYHLLLKLYSRWGRAGLLALSAAAIIFSVVTDAKIGDVNVYYTVIGHLPVICLGIYLAKHDISGLRIPKSLFFLALSIFMLGNYFKLFWYVSHLTFLVMLLYAFHLIVPKIRDSNIGARIVLFLGHVSMPLFLVHGFLRDPFIGWAIYYDHWLLTLALCFVSLAVSLIFAIALPKLERLSVRSFDGWTRNA